MRRLQSKVTDYLKVEKELRDKIELGRNRDEKLI